MHPAVNQAIMGVFQSECSKPEYPKNNIASSGVYRIRNGDANTQYRVVDGDVGEYDIVLTRCLLRRSNPTLKAHIGTRRALIVIDPAVADNYQEQLMAYLEAHHIEYQIFPLEAKKYNEENKDILIFASLAGLMMLADPEETTDVVIAFGGGVTLDLAGFLACTLSVSLPYLAIPTTLTAMIDAAISPKTAINVHGWKNAIGTHYAPEVALCDHTFLSTTSRQSIRAGMAEMSKLAIVRSRPLFNCLEWIGKPLLDDYFQDPLGAMLIEISIVMFLAMKWEHPFPGNKPASMRSFGHKLSRRFEALTGFELMHGEAVAIEMAAACQLSSMFGFLSQEDVKIILALFRHLGLPIYHKRFEAELMWHALERRSQMGKSFFFPIPGQQIGSGRFLDHFTLDQLREAIERCRCEVQRPEQTSGSSE